MKLTPILFGISLIFVSCSKRNKSSDLSVFTTDSGKNYVEKFVPKSILKKRFNKLMNKTSVNMINSLEDFDSHSPWELKRFTLGLMIVGEAKLTPKYKLEVEPSIELRFEKLPRP